MSENNKIQNEEELWDLLSEPVTGEPKAAKPKVFKPEPKETPAPKAEPVAAAEPVVKAEPAPAAEPVKSGRKIDGFFMACMAGVAAVSVAATLLVSGMLGGSTPAGTDRPISGSSDNMVVLDEEDMEEIALDTMEEIVAAMERENAELRAQLEQQTEQIKALQNDLISLMGSEEFFATASTDPSENNEVLSAQMAALDTFAKIQEAYADFDREKLEELIPQMDEQLEYLTPEMLNNYYLILEYVEQPSNG